MLRTLEAPWSEPYEIELGTVRHSATDGQPSIEMPCEVPGVTCSNVTSPILNNLSMTKSEKPHNTQNVDQLTYNTSLPSRAAVGMNTTGITHSGMTVMKGPEGPCRTGKHIPILQRTQYTNTTKPPPSPSPATPPNHLPSSISHQTSPPSSPHLLQIATTAPHYPPPDHPLPPCHAPQPPPIAHLTSNKPPPHHISSKSPPQHPTTHHPITLYRSSAAHPVPAAPAHTAPRHSVKHAGVLEKWDSCPPAAIDPTIQHNERVEMKREAGRHWRLFFVRTQ
ncbi:hypothetical protein V495_03734, partial [Pseudogymnoascus sp. VKM F-4514 (FW-929)]